MFTVELKGAEQLNRALEQLGGAGARKVARSAIRKGAKPIQASAKSNARSIVGGSLGAALAKYVKIKAFSRSVARRVPGVSVLVDAAGNDEFVVTSKAGRRNYIPSAIEYGHDNAAPIPFMRQAFETKKAAALSAVTSALRAGIEREAKRLAKAGAAA